MRVWLVNDYFSTSLASHPFLSVSTLLIFHFLLIRTLFRDDGFLLPSCKNHILQTSPTTSDGSTSTRMITRCGEIIIDGSGGLDCMLWDSALKRKISEWKRLERMTMPCGESRNELAAVTSRIREGENARATVKRLVEPKVVMLKRKTYYRQYLSSKSIQRWRIWPTARKLHTPWKGNVHLKFLRAYWT